MKKKNCMLLCTIMVTVLLVTSCTTDMDTEGPLVYTPQEKAAIENLAKEYGLNYKLLDGPVINKMTLEDFEKEFEAISKIVGEYDFINEEHGCNNISTGNLISRNGMKSASMPKTENETGSGEGHCTDSYAWFSFYVTIKWDFNKLNIEDQSEFSLSITKTPTYYSTHSYEDQLEDPKIDFDTDGYYCMPVNKEIYYHENISFRINPGKYDFYIDGSYNTNNNYGSVQVSN